MLMFLWLDKSTNDLIWGLKLQFCRAAIHQLLITLVLMCLLEMYDISWAHGLLVGLLDAVQGRLCSIYLRDLSCWGAPPCAHCAFPRWPGSNQGNRDLGKRRAACADLYHSSNNFVSIMPMALITEVDKFVNLSLWSLRTHRFGFRIVFVCCWLRCSQEGGEAIDYILHTSTHSILLPLIMIHTPFPRHVTVFRLDHADVTKTTGGGSLSYLYTSVTS